MKTTSTVLRRTPEATARQHAQLVGHALTLVRRDGVAALTMRGLASEAGCAVGLLYKVFADREELVIEVVVSELDDLGGRMATWAAETGIRSVSENLDRYASILLDAEAPALIDAESIDVGRLNARLAESVGGSTFFDSLGSAVAHYLSGEQRNGRVRADVDVEAFGFAITGAIHNLVAAWPGYPRPSRTRLSDYLRAVSVALAPGASGA